MWVRLSSMKGNGGAVWREVLDVSAGLDVLREVTGVLTAFDNEDPQGWVGGG